MALEILIATPNISFGELLRLSLEENDTYRASLATTLSKAEEIATQQPLGLIILDAEISEQPIDDIIQQILQMHPLARFLIIRPESAPEWISDIPNPFSVIQRPFFISNVLEQADTLLLMDSVEKNPYTLKTTGESEQNPAAWLQNLELAGIILTSFLRDSTTHTAIILNNGSLYHSQGYLGTAEVAEISDLVQRYWDIENHADLARFIKLKSSGGKYLLYVREFQPGVLLALVEDIRTPISIAGTQAGHLKQLLTEQVNASLPEFLENPVVPEDESFPVDSHDTFTTQFSEQSANGQPDEFVESFEVAEELSPEEQLQQQKVLEMLADLPTPDPKPYPEITTADGVDKLSKEIPETSGKESNGARIDWEIEEFIADQAAGLFTDETTQEKFPELDQPVNEILNHEKQVSHKPKEAFPGAIPVSYPGKEAGSSHHPEPATPAMADLTYTCVLIPRLPFHRLSGDLELQLSRWLPDLCLAFGWRLVRLQIEPEYILWSTQVAPGVSPASVLRIIRQRTSFRIFENFSHYRLQNPSGDFWAPGYLVLSGSSLPEETLLADFIHQTRQRQGIPIPRIL